MRIETYKVLGHEMEVNPEDRIISYRLRRGIVYESGSVWAITNYLRKGQTFVNIGANIGYFTLIMAQAVGKEGRGFAFEPDPANFGILKRNVERHKYENVTLEQCAIGDRDGEAPLYLNPRRNLGDHRLWQSQNTPRKSIPVRIRRLDDYFKGLRRHIDFIKMDIQGAEALALSGMSSILENTDNLDILMEFWPWGLRGCGSDPWKTLANIINLGFLAYNVNEDGSIQPILSETLPGMITRPRGFHPNIWFRKRQ